MKRLQTDTPHTSDTQNHPIPDHCPCFFGLSAPSRHPSMAKGQTPFQPMTPAMLAAKIAKNQTPQWRGQLIPDRVLTKCSIDVMCETRWGLHFWSLFHYHRQLSRNTQKSCAWGSQERIESCLTVYDLQTSTLQGDKAPLSPWKHVHAHSFKQVSSKSESMLKRACVLLLK